MTQDPQNVLILNSTEIKLLLPMQECIEIMSDALQDLSRGEVIQPLRMVVRPPDAKGVMAMMPAYRRGDDLRVPDCAHSHRGPDVVQLDRFDGISADRILAALVRRILPQR